MSRTFTKERYVKNLMEGISWMQVDRALASWQHRSRHYAETNYTEHQ
jgi:hypothetical protein